MKNFLKSIFQSNSKALIKHFLCAELDDLNREIKEGYENIRLLEEKRQRVELMVFGN